MKKVSNEFINLSKKIKTQDLKLTINDGELTVQEVHLMSVNIFNAIPISRLRARKQVIAKELKHSFEGQLFKTIMQQIEITVKNASEIKGKYVDFQYGIQINNEFEYVDMGEYYIKDVEDDKNKEELVVTGYDKMLNFMKTFKQSDLQLTYPCEMSQLVNRMGEVCGVELYSTNFFNSNLIVDEDFFTAQELTYRDVLEKVAQATLTTIFIKEGKLYLCKIGDSVQTLDTSFLSDLVIGEKFGPVNALVLGRGSVEDNIESVNQDSININGRCEIRFDENEFVDSKREDVIDLMLQQIEGLEYYAIEASNLGLLWLDPCDVITAKDREESEYKSIYLKASVTINTGIKGEMEAGIPEETTTEYKVTTKEEKKALKVERLAKKNEGLIQDLIVEYTETSEKLTQVEQNVDGITQKVQSIEDFTREKESINKLLLNDCAEGEDFILEFRIKGDTDKFKCLTPSDDLTPSDNLVPLGGHFTLVSDTESTQSENAVEIDIIAIEPLRDLYGICDELVIKNDVGTIIRRIGRVKEIVDISYCVAGKALNAIGDVYNKENSMTTRYIKVDENKIYYCKTENKYEDQKLTLKKVCFYNSNLEFIDYEDITGLEEYETTQITHYFTTPADTKFIRLSLEDEMAIDSVLDYGLSVTDHAGELNDLYLLESEIVEDIGKIKIPTFEGDTYLYVKEYSSLSYYCKYITKNDYIDAFALQKDLDNAVVELDSSITQTAKEINLEVSKKIGKTEAVSLINQTAEEINTEVRKKVGNDEIISKINQSAEAITINSNRVSLNRQNYKFNK